jgi:ketosteroid isomerase-like protein
MSPENVELVRHYFELVQRAYDAYFQDPRSLEGRLRAGEVAPEVAEAMHYVHPNIEWKSALIGVTSRGYEGTARGLDRLLEAAQRYRVSVQEVTRLRADQVLAVLELAMKGKASDIDVETVIFSLVTVRDGLITRMDEYLDRAEALEAAGLRD